MKGIASVHHHHCCPSHDSQNEEAHQFLSAGDLPLLPVPFTRTRLVELLGTVTMVCFVDDDIVCEGYSVVEEVFLLKPSIEGGASAAGTPLPQLCLSKAGE